MCALAKVITDVFRLGEETVVGVVPGYEKQFYRNRQRCDFFQLYESCLIILDGFV